MEIRLQDAIRAIQGAVGADMQDLVLTAGVMTGAWTPADKSPLVPGQKQNLFSKRYRIL